MTIISLSDMHGNAEGVKKIGSELQECDVTLLAGDITHFGAKKEATEMLRQVKQYSSRVLAVPGNCDYPGVTSLLDETNLNLHARVNRIQDVIFIGLGGSLPCPGHTPNEYNEAEYSKILDVVKKGYTPGLPLVLLSHQPPYGTLNDTVSPGYHVGSHAVRLFIEQVQPTICFCGHIHEGVGIDTIGGTRIVNPGPFRHGGYAYATLGGSKVNVEIRGRN